MKRLFLLWGTDRKMQQDTVTSGKEERQRGADSKDLGELSTQESQVLPLDSS